MVVEFGLHFVLLLSNSVELYKDMRCFHIVEILERNRPVNNRLWAMLVYLYEVLFGVC